MGGVVGVIPKADRNATDERFSRVESSASQTKGKVLDKRNKILIREENGCRAASGSPPQAIWGHYRLLSDIQHIQLYIPLDTVLQRGFYNI